MPDGMGQTLALGIDSRGAREGAADFEAAMDRVIASGRDATASVEKMSRAGTSFRDVGASAGSAAGGVGKFGDASRRAADSARSLEGASRSGASGLARLGGAAREASATMDVLKGTLASAGIIIGADMFFQLGRGLLSAADSMTRMNNQLLVTAGSGELAASAFAGLFQIAQQTKAPVEDLVTLFSRMNISAKEVGATQKDLFAVTSAVGQALRISGVSSQQASGALLQFAQAIGSGVVRAEEFNSMIEGGMLPLLQEIATRVEAADGSVAKLRQLVIAGNMPSDTFFRAAAESAAALEERTRSMGVTVGQSMTVARNSFVALVGAMDKATGATAALAEGIVSLADGMDGATQSFAGNYRAAMSLVDGYREVITYLGQLSDKRAEVERGFQSQVQSTLDGWLRSLGLDADAINDVAGRIQRALSGQTAAEYVRRLSDDDIPARSTGSGGRGGRRTYSTPTERQKSVQETIVNRADRYGVDRRTALTIARIENPQMDPSAKNPRSSATGIYQFTAGTWHDYGRGASATDATANIDAGMRYLADVIKSLETSLGRKPKDWEVYLGHQQGAAGAASILTRPAASAVDTVGRDAVVNNAGSAGMTNAEFAALWRRKYEDADPDTAVDRAYQASSERATGAGRDTSAATVREAERAKRDAAAETTRFYADQYETRLGYEQMLAEWTEQNAKREQDAQALLNTLAIEYYKSQGDVLAALDLRHAAAMKALAAEAELLQLTPEQRTGATAMLGETQAAERAGVAKRLEDETNGVTGATDNLADAMDGFGIAASSAFEDAIVSGAKLRDVLVGLAEDLQRLLIRKVITEQVAGAVQDALQVAGGGKATSGSWLSSLLGLAGKVATAASGSSASTATTASAEMHTGGVAGSAGVVRFVHPAVLADAPRYHSGGVAGVKPDEVPAILRRGEVVATPAQWAAQGRGGNAVNVVINNQAGADVSAEKDDQGNVQVDIQRALDESVAGVLGRTGSRANRAMIDQTSGSRKLIAR